MAAETPHLTHDIYQMEIHLKRWNLPYVLGRNKEKNNGPLHTWVIEKNTKNSPQILFACYIKIHVWDNSHMLYLILFFLILTILDILCYNYSDPIIYPLLFFHLPLPSTLLPFLFKNGENPFTTNHFFVFFFFLFKIIGQYPY